MNEQEQWQEFREHLVQFTRVVGKKFAFSHGCECGGWISVEVSGVGDTGAVSGVVCNKCERTYTFRWSPNGPELKQEAQA